MFEFKHIETFGPFHKKSSGSFIKCLFLVLDNIEKMSIESIRGNITINYLTSAV